MRLPYGFCYNSDGHIAIDNEKSDIVRMIYRQYLSGMSLGRIADFLYQQGIPSPTGKMSWTQPVISDLLSNKKYIGSIVSFDEYFMVQGEKETEAILMRIQNIGKPPGTALRAY